MSRNKLDQSFGVALTNCWFCGEGASVIMNTRLTPAMAQKVESMNNKMIFGEGCSKCEKAMEDGAILLIVYDETKTPDSAFTYKPEDGIFPNPYRTGELIGVSVGFIERHIQISKDEGFDDMAGYWSQTLRHKWGFIPKFFCDAIGLTDAFKKVVSDNPNG